MFNCSFVTFLCGILGQVWYLIVLIPDLCPLSYFGGKVAIACFLQYHCLLYFKTKSIFREKNTIFFEIITCDTLIYAMDHSAFIVCSIMENSIGLSEMG